jgi:hypothetical protein
VIRVGFFLKPIATGWDGGPDGESRHSLLPGANSRRAAALAMRTLAGSLAGSMRRMRRHIVLDFQRN